MLNGPYLDAVRAVNVGVLPSEVPASFLSTPVVLYCAAYPSIANGGAGAGAQTSTTEYTGTAEIACGGHSLLDESGFYRFVDTLDDLATIICEKEQLTAWSRLDSPATYGETIRLLASGEVGFEYPSLKDDSGKFYHFATVRWSWRAFITWG